MPYRNLRGQSEPDDWVYVAGLRNIHCRLKRRAACRAQGRHPRRHSVSCASPDHRITCRDRRGIRGRLRRRHGRSSGGVSYRVQLFLGDMSAHEGSRSQKQRDTRPVTVSDEMDHRGQRAVGLPDTKSHGARVVVDITRRTVTRCQEPHDGIAAG